VVEQDDRSLGGVRLGDGGPDAAARAGHNGAQAIETARPGRRDRVSRWVGRDRLALHARRERVTRRL
jgi:hypothetical protein